MNNFDNSHRFDAFEIERAARRMQAETLANSMRGVGRWLKRRIG